MYNRPSGDNGALSDSDAALDDHTRAKPRSVLNGDLAKAASEVRRLEVMVCSDDQRVARYDNIPADINSTATIYLTVPTNVAMTRYSDVLWCEHFAATEHINVRSGPETERAEIARSRN